ncbi:MAG: GNAT family N-acetyltransferase [Pseudomonadota bacterium]
MSAAPSVEPVPSATDLIDTIEATWPAAEVVERGGWRLRRGEGGGQRVSAALRLDPGADVDEAAAAMRGWGQRPLFQLLDGDDDLDRALAERGYVVTDRSPFYVCPTVTLLDDAPETARILRGDLRIALIEEIWAQGGLSPARLQVMDRVTVPKQYILARLGDRPAGVAFVGVHGDIGMVHAVEVLAHQRRKGMARMLMAAAARFAAERGARQFALATTGQNIAANALYQALGMALTARYHYRAAPDEGGKAEWLKKRRA